jgi:uncharacterized membrane protein
MSERPNPASAGRRLTVSAIVGLLTGLFLVQAGFAKYAALGFWDSAALVYGIWIWLSVHQADATRTKQLAVRENPGKAVADILLLVASVASLIAVLFLLANAGNSQGSEKFIDVTLGLASVVISWATVHIVYMLRYARMYYGDPEGGVDFGDKAPTYGDFAYLSFTLGMTFQVSDTGLQTGNFRTMVLRHTLLSYLFGTVIIATTINTIASLTQIA